MFESLQALKGEQSKARAGNGSNHVTAKAGFQHHCPLPPVIGAVVTLMADGVTRANISNNTRVTDKSGTHTFGEI